MVLNNYKKVLTGLGYNSNEVYYVSWTSYDGVIRSVIKANPGSVNMRYGNYAYVGSGTTAVTAEDYTLENDITSSFSNYAMSQATIYEDGKVVTTYTITGNNSTANSLTISEVGIAKYVYIGSQQDRMLVVRHLLDEPVVVPAGRGFRIILEWVEQ